MLPTLQEAIAAIKAGDKKTGRAYLAEILQADPENEIGWLWLAGIVESDERRRQCLERVLEINPDNQAARRGLATLPPKPAAPSEPPAPAHLGQPGPLLSRLAARQQAETDKFAKVDLTPVEEASQKPKPPPQPEPSPSPASAPPEAIPAELPSQPPPVRPQEPAPPQDDVPAGESERLEPEAAHEEAIRAAEPGEEAARFWQTDQGKLIIGGGMAGLLILCVACVAAIMVFQPLFAQIPPTVAAAVGTPTPTSTFTATPAPPTPTPTYVPTPTTTPTLTASPTSTQVVANTPTVTLTPTRTPTSRNIEEATVIGVVSGDTIDVLIDGVNYRVNYIMAVAPALDDPETGPEPFGPEALELNRSLVEGKQVQLEKDERETDEAGRLLRYVYVDDLMVNEELIRQGLARAILVPPNTKYGARLQETEQAAQQAGLGIWSLEPSG